MNGNERHPTGRVLLNASQLSAGSVTYTEEADKYPTFKQRAPYQILIISDDPDNCMTLTIILEREGWDTVCTSSVSECNKVLSVGSFDLVFCDRYLPDGGYRDVLAIIATLKYHLSLVVTSRHADWDQYLEALRHGAFELIVSPCRGSDVLWALTQADRRH
jgi:two-component system NtrC family response regulator